MTASAQRAGVLIVMLVMACTSANLGSSRGGEDVQADRGEGGDAGVLAWTCPEDWVRTVWGGCGPAVLLCGPDGGAASGACQGVDITRPRMISEDGGVGTSFYVLPDGGLSGGWEQAGIPTCPEGWTRTEDGVCDPNLPARCPTGEAIPGGRCITSECGTEMFPPRVAPEGAGRVVYARVGEDDGLADGSSERPFATLRRAVQEAGVGGVVLLAAGTYSEHVMLQQRVKIIGRCAASVVIEGRDANEEGVVMMRGGDAVVELRGVTIRGETRGVVIAGGAQAVLREVVVDRARNAGVSVAGTGSNVRVERSVVRRTQPRLDDGASFAVSVIEGATGLFVESAIFAEGGVGIGAGARLRDAESLGTFRDVTFRGDGATLPPTVQVAVIALVQANAVLERVVVEGFASRGLIASAPTGMRGGRIEARDVVLSHIRSSGGDTPGSLSASEGGTIRAERLLITDSRGIGAVSGAEGSSLTLLQSVVRRIEPPPTSRFGICVSAGQGGRLELHGVRLEECDEGISITTGARGTVQNCQVIRTGIGGVSANRPETTLDVRDTLIDTVRSMALSNGVGAVALSGARLSLSRVWTRRCLAMGAMVMAEGARMEVRDSIFSEIEGTVAREYLAGETGGGFGLTAGGEGELLAERVAIVDSGGAGIAAIQGITRDDREVYNAHIEAADLFVRGVRERSLFTDTMSRSPPVSVGYYAADQSSVRVARGVVCGAQYGAYTTSGAFSFEDVVFHEVSRCGVSSNQPTVPPMLRSVRFYGVPRELCEDEVIGNIVVPTVDLGSTP